MLGMVCWQEQGSVQPERLQVAGMSVLCVRVRRGGRGEQRRLVRAERLLRRTGVRRMLENRAGQPRLCGLPTVESLPLYRAMAPQLILEILACKGVQPERASIILRGEYPDGDLTATALALCPWVRQVIVDTNRGGEMLQRALLQRFGVAVGPVTDERERLCVRFSGASLGEDLDLGGYTEPDGLEVDAPQIVLPETLVRTSALCALWQSGCLQLTQVQVSRTAQGE